MGEAEFPTKAALYAGVAFILAVAAVIGTVALMLWHWGLPAGGPSTVPANAIAFSGPALQTAPQAEMANGHAPSASDAEAEATP